MADHDDPEVVDQAANSSLALIDENQWALVLREEKCVRDAELALKSRVETFLEVATQAEKRTLETERDQLWSLMKEAKASHSKRNPEQGDGVVLSTRERFKKGYNATMKTGYQLSHQMDIFVDQAPEFAALVYGAIKIILLVQVNNEELKQGVYANLQAISKRFALVDHLPELMPQKNLIVAVADAYSIFSKFLAKAIKYYTECRALRLLKAFTSPWKIRFKDIIDEIDTKFREIQDIATAQTQIVAHQSLMVGQMNIALSKSQMESDERMWNVIKHIPEQIQQLEEKLKAISFENSKDIAQTCGGIQQRLEERFSGAAKLGISDDTRDEGDIDEEFFDIFVDLHELETDIHQSVELAGDRMASKEQKAKRHSLFQSEKVIEWIESEQSQLLWLDGNYIFSHTDFLTTFVTPLAIDASCNYESIAIIKYFTTQGSKSRHTALTLMQSLLVQLLKQYRSILEHARSPTAPSALREAGTSLIKLWEIFEAYIHNLTVDRIYIIVDSVDDLSSDADDYKTLMSRLNTLIDNNKKVTKVLLTSRLLSKPPNAADISNALSLSRKKWSLDPFQDELSSMQAKYTEIYEGRCKSIAFSELMLLYPPQTVIFTNIDSEYSAFVVHETGGMVETMPGRLNPLQLRVWSINHNGKYFTKRYQNFSISQFSGMKLLSSLRFIPAGYLPNESRVRSSMMGRGRKYWSFDKPILKFCSGQTNGKVMVDLMLSSSSEVPSQEYEDQFDVISVEHVKPLTLLLCPAVVSAYNFHELRWKTFKIDDLREVEFKAHQDDMMPPNRGYELIQARASLLNTVSTSGHHNPQSEILTLLLLGPPGSGKSSFISTLSEFIKVPLLAIDASRFGGSETNTEDQIQGYFSMASRWKAILHFQRAEILLEATLERGGGGMQPVAKMTNLQAFFFKELKQSHCIVALSAIEIEILAEEITQLISLFMRFSGNIGFNEFESKWRSVVADKAPFIDSSVAAEFIAKLASDPTNIALFQSSIAIRNVLDQALAMAAIDGRQGKSWEQQQRSVTLQHLNGAAKTNIMFLKRYRTLRELGAASQNRK